MTAVTEGLVDAKDQARQAESRTDLAHATLSLEQRRPSFHPRMEHPCGARTRHLVARPQVFVT